MVLDPTKFDASYFGDTVASGGIKTTYGYSNYIKIKETDTKVKTISEHFGDLTGKSVLDVGGAIGVYAKYAKDLGCTEYDVLDLNIDGWCEANLKEEVDGFMTGNAVEKLKEISDNSYDLVFTSQLLDCLSDSHIALILKEINRISIGGSIHVVTPNSPKDWYNPHELSWYKIKGYTDMTFINYETNEKIIT